MAIDWTRGYTATWRLYDVDLGTWTKRRRNLGVFSASVERDDTSDAPELESASIELDQAVGEEFSERHMRLVMIAEQDGARDVVDVCTMLFSSTSGNTQRGLHTRSLKGRSVIYPASTTRAWMAYGTYVPSGSDGAAEVGKMLSSSILAPVSVEGSFELAEPYVFSRDESVLSASWKILKAGGHRIRIDGRGQVSIQPQATAEKPSLSLSGENMRVVIPGIADELDLSSVPNMYIAEENGETSVVTNDDATSEVSTVRRGYVNDIYDSAPIRVNGESLEAYARRMLSEKSIVADAREWQREWWPDVLPGDFVRAHMPREGVSGDFRVRRQSLKCGAGIVLTERVEREVVVWQAN